MDSSLRIPERHSSASYTSRITRPKSSPAAPGSSSHRQSASLDRLLNDVPTLKPQLASASWVGQRRWDLSFQSGETVALPEGHVPARAALQRFAKMDRSNGLLGRGIVRFDLRIPGKMIVHYNNSNRSICYGTLNGQAYESQSDDGNTMRFRSDVLKITTGVFDDYYE